MDNEQNAAIQEDLLSNLPDDILRHIFSVLKMPEAVRTCVLSPRYKNLWRTMSSLDFHIPGWPGTTEELKSFIDRSFVLWDGSKIEKLAIKFPYRAASDASVLSWVLTGLRRNVESLSLDMLGQGNLDIDPRFELPYSLYTCMSLEKLTLKSCRLKLPPSMALQSLRKLVLVNMDLSQEMIECITTSCHNLEMLHLGNCNRQRRLDILIRSEKLHVLEICETFGFRYALSIGASNLQSLVVKEGVPRPVYIVDPPLESLGKACFEDVSTNPYLCERHTSFGFVSLFCALRTVKKLKLCRSVTQVGPSDRNNFDEVTYWESKILYPHDSLIVVDIWCVPRSRRANDIDGLLASVEPCVRFVRFVAKQAEKIEKLHLHCHVVPENHHVFLYQLANSLLGTPTISQVLSDFKVV